MSISPLLDPDRPHQTDAVDAVLGLFEDQQSASLLGPQAPTALSTGVGDGEAYGNNLNLDLAALSHNLRKVQERSGIPEEMRLTQDGLIDSADFSVEMETGTGKTYVYVRAMMEMNQQFGFTKFVIVVPNIAIRETVLGNLRTYQEHFKTVFGSTYEFRAYNSKYPNELRSFAVSNRLEILVINIDAFNQDNNLIYRRGHDSTFGIPPIEFLQATLPVVILDEPQNLEGAAAQAGLRQLGASVTLRFSATHRTMVNPVYRLTPVDAYNSGLVKTINVYSVLAEEDPNNAFIELVKVKRTSNAVTADVVIDVSSGVDTSRKKVKLRYNRQTGYPDLFDLSGGRAEYRGFNVVDIAGEPNRVVFGNGEVIEEGAQHGLDVEAIQKVAIETAVDQHFKKELELHRAYLSGDIPQPIKPLTLFFIDRVANYHPPEAKFRKWFEDAYNRLVKRADYRDLGLPAVSQVHDGYFAVSDRGVPKDSRDGRDTQADRSAYELIMKRRDLLVDPAEPMRFIWSHSALREGWDNPNVFTIATLNDTHSTMKKRQEIGRGLRLPWMADGRQCTNANINKLVVVANEAYEEFASKLQREIEDETSTSFDRSNIGNARTKRQVRVKEEALNDPAFRALWQAINSQTSYRVSFDTDSVVAAAVKRLIDEPTIRRRVITEAAAQIKMDTGVRAEAIPGGRPTEVPDGYPVPDLLARLVEMTQLSRSTIARILIESNRLGEVSNNPVAFIDQAARSIRGALGEVLVSGVQYLAVGGGYELNELTDRVANSFAAQPLVLDKSVFDEVIYDGPNEKEFAERINRRDDVLWFMKLPWWFKVDTPIGNYNPDWAVCHLLDDNTKVVFLVKETKGVEEFAKLRKEEQLKIRFGERHFEALGIPYEWVASGAEGVSYVLPAQGTLPPRSVAVRADLPPAE